MNETKERVKGDLIKVLAEYEDVTWESNAERDNAIEFWVRGKHIVYQYDQTNLNARSDLRRKLRDLGALPKVTPPTAAVPPPIDQPQPSAPPVPPVMTPPPPPLIAQPDIPAAPRPPEQPRSVVHSRGDGYTIFQSQRVIGIEIDRDLTITRGNVLVIPLHRSNTFIEMPSEQFHILFDEATATPVASPTPPPIVRPASMARPAPVEEPQRQREPRQPAAASGDVRTAGENDILAYLQQRNGAVRSKIIATALNKTLKSIDGHLRRLQDRGIVVAPQPGFWTLASKPSPVIKPSEKPAVPTQAMPENAPRSRGGVSPQVGRILAAMAYVTKSTGKTDLTTAQVVTYLDARDGKQYGARLPDMVKNGLVARGLPLGTARGWHYHITAKGLTLIRQLRTWVYEHDHQKPPDWLAHL